MMDLSKDLTVSYDERDQTIVLQASDQAIRIDRKEWEALVVFAAKLRQSHRFGMNNGSTKLTTEAVAVIENWDASQSVIAAAFGISQGHVSRIKRNTRSGRTGQ